MQIHSNSNQNFGMALYMPKASTIERQLGKRLAQEAEIARPKLRELAKDVDIVINTRENADIECKGFNIRVSNIEPNPIKRFFLDPKQYIDGSVKNYDTYDNNVSDVLVRKVTKLKDKFIYLNS